MVSAKSNRCLQDVCHELCNDTYVPPCSLYNCKDKIKLTYSFRQSRSQRHACLPFLAAAAVAWEADRAAREAAVRSAAELASAEEIKQRVQAAVTRELNWHQCNVHAVLAVCLF